MGEPWPPEASPCSQKTPLLEAPPAAAPAPQTDGPVPWRPPPGFGDYCEPATLGSSVWQLRTPMLFVQWFWGLGGAGKHRCGGTSRQVGLSQRSRGGTCRGAQRAHPGAADGIEDAWAEDAEAKALGCAGYLQVISPLSGIITFSSLLPWPPHGLFPPSSRKVRPCQPLCSNPPSTQVLTGTLQDAPASPRASQHPQLTARQPHSCWWAYKSSVAFAEEQ